MELLVYIGSFFPWCAKVGSACIMLFSTICSTTFDAIYKAMYVDLSNASCIFHVLHASLSICVTDSYYRAVLLGARWRWYRLLWFYASVDLQEETPHYCAICETGACWQPEKGIVFTLFLFTFSFSFFVSVISSLVNAFVVWLTNFRECIYVLGFQLYIGEWASSSCSSGAFVSKRIWHPCFSGCRCGCCILTVPAGTAHYSFYVCVYLDEWVGRWASVCVCVCYSVVVDPLHSGMVLECNSVVQ